MKILGVASPKSGCTYHRVYNPLGYMDDIETYVTDNISKDRFEEGWDIVFYNKTSMFDQHQPAFKEKYGTKFVVDIDDDWDVPRNDLNYWFNIDYAPVTISNIKQADLVTCTNERLARKIKSFNENVIVIPNALPFGEGQYDSETYPSDKIRIFWSGSPSHEGDLEAIRNPIKRLKAFAHKIEMVIGGYNEDNQTTIEIWNKMIGYFTASKQLPHRVLDSLLPDEYMELYKHADIMLIPLQDSEWNASKSNLKILEAASKKLAVICQAVEPYINDYDAPVLWVYKQSDWFNHLNLLINNPKLIKEYGEKIYEWAKEKYDIRKHNVDRRKGFANILEV